MNSVTTIVSEIWPITLAFLSGLALSALLSKKCRRATPPQSAQEAGLAAAKDTEIKDTRLLTDNLAAAIVLRNSEGRIVYCSPYTEVLTGYSRAEILASRGDFFLSIMHEDDREKYERALNICRTGEAFQFRFRFFHSSGFELWAETRTVPIVDTAGTLQSSLSITLDVTGTVRYQRQVEEKNRDLQDFAYMVSHDLKAPIFTIKGMLTVIAEDHAANLTPELAEALDHIRRSSDRLEQLVSRVLEFSRLSNQELANEIVDLSSTIREVEKDFDTQLKESGGRIIVGPMPAVIGDPVQLYRVFANLVGNAIKYRSPDRTLEIKIHQVPNRLRRVVSIAIEDNGRGVSEDQIPLLFRPFHRVQGTGVEGSGIGLASVKKILEKLGGQIEVISALNEGSCFTVSLRQAASEKLSEAKSQEN